MMHFGEQIFCRARFDPEKAEAYGFTKTEDGHEIALRFMDGAFEAVIGFDGNGKFSGRVVDCGTGEEYDQIDNPRYTGAFIGTVREAYENLLMEIARNCCPGTGYGSGQAGRITELIYEKYGIEPDFPWDDGSRYEQACVFRHQGNSKWFALLMNIGRRSLDPDDADEHVDVMNLKADEKDAERLYGIPGVYPAYHMNHKKWISVTLDDIMSDDAVMELVRASFDLTAPSGSRIDEDLIRRVLGIADSVPPGHVATYGQIAKLAGREKNSRLIGKIMSMADRYGEHPCHRVVNASGRTVPGWTEQRAMLEREGITFRANGCVDMEKHRWKYQA